MLKLWKRTSETAANEQGESPDGPRPSKRPKIEQLHVDPAEALTETVVVYDILDHAVDTKLLEQLHAQEPSEISLRPHFRAARYVLLHVGSCASDLCWRRVLPKLEAETSSYEPEDEGKKHLVVKAKARDILRNWAFTMPNLDPRSQRFNVSPKLLKLVEVLKSCEPCGDSFRGLIFVHRRAAALAVVDILQTLHELLPFIRPCTMVGSNTTSPQEQLAVIRKFAGGSCNLIVATKGHQDLDFPQASIVICFDVFDGIVSKAYMLSRCNPNNGRLVQMVARNNAVHRRIISSHTAQLDPALRKWMKDVMCGPQRLPPPPPALRQTSEETYHSDTEEDADAEETATELIRDPTTNGRIYMDDATSVIYRYMAGSCITASSAGIFKFTQTKGEHTCTIILRGSHCSGITGIPSSSMAHARRQACFQACLELSRCGELPQDLFPIPPGASQRQDLDIRTGFPHLFSKNSQDAKTENTSKSTYPRRSPAFWVNTLSVPVTFLYPVIVYAEGTSQRRAPMMILTRQPFPLLPVINLFFDGVPTQFQVKPGAAFSLEDKCMQQIYLYTLRICRALSNRRATCPLHKMPYFFAPLRTGWSASDHCTQGSPRVVDLIPWDLVHQAVESWVVNINIDAIDEQLRDAIIQDRMVELTRRFDVIGIRHDLNPLSKPSDSLREAKHDNILEFTKSVRADTELKDFGQPLVEVTPIPAITNHINPSLAPSMTLAHPATKYLIPEFCGKFTIPASTFRMATLLPSILRRIDDILLVKELNATLFRHRVSENHLHAAISTLSARTEHDYERLEFLGDSFLKYIFSIDVFVREPLLAEGALHAARSEIINNKFLLESAIRVGLPEFIQSSVFQPRHWLHSNFLDAPVEGKVEVVKSNVPVPAHMESQTGKSAKKMKHRKKSDENQSLSDKTVADVVEGIIGAAYLSGGREIALATVKALNLPLRQVDQWSDFARIVRFNVPDPTSRLTPHALAATQMLIGYTFPTHRIQILAQALTSFGQKSTSHERLEFLGDAVLESMVTRHIFSRHSQLSPGGLTILRSAMTCNSALGAVCVSSGLYQHLVLEPAEAAKVDAIVMRFRAKQEAEYRLAGVEQRPPGQYWADIHPPKVLADAVEAVIGAIHVSNGFSSDEDSFFCNVLVPFFDKHIILSTLSHHPMKSFNELLHAYGCQSGRIDTAEVQGGFTCTVVVHETVIASATAQNRASAVHKGSGIEGT